MFAKWEGSRIVILCWLICLSAPIAISGLIMTFGATEWRFDDEPVPWPLHAIDAFFFTDLFSTVLLLCLVRTWHGVFASVIAIALLCLTAVVAFWGGLWVSGQWL